MFMKRAAICSAIFAVLCGGFFACDARRLAPREATGLGPKDSGSAGREGVSRLKAGLRMTYGN